MKTTIFYLLIFLTSIGANANKFYIDPVNGDINNSGTASSPWSTLQDVINNNYIESYENSPLPYDESNNQLIIKNQGALVKSGDTLLLLSGLHGDIFLSNYNNSSNIVVMAAENQTAVFKSLHLQACTNWIFKNITISPEPYGTYYTGKMVFIETHSWQGPSKKIEISNCEIYSSTTAWTDSASWINKAADGIYISGDSVLIKNNNLTNVHMGISAAGNYIKCIDNNIVNFSGDGMRMLGSYNLFEHNLIKNCYDVDENHDDGIQAFTTEDVPLVFDTIRRNIIINYDNPNQALRGDLQGIGCFDGFFNNWAIENNLVYVEVWHGITLLGANDCKIVNNTVLNPSLDSLPDKTWIMVDNHKNGTHSTNCYVKNNLTNFVNFSCDGGEQSNNVLISSYSDYIDNFVDYNNFDFHLNQSSVAIDACDDNFAPAYDLDLNTRPVGQASDAGCYEFDLPSGISDLSHTNKMSIYPTPANNTLYFNAKNDGDIFIYNNTGVLVLHQKIHTNKNNISSINISSLPNGFYILKTGTKSYKFIIKH